MFIVVDWADWLVNTRITKFESTAADQMGAWIGTFDSNRTVFTFNTDENGGIELQVVEMLRGRSASSVVELYNALDPNQTPIKSFHDKEAAQRRVGLRILDRADKLAFASYTPRPQGQEGGMPSPKAMTKSTSSGKDRAQKAPKSGGVIDAIVQILRNGGGTVNEIFEQLKVRFPDRGDGMKTTVSIQVKRLHDSGKVVVKREKIEGRGTVFSADPE